MNTKKKWETPDFYIIDSDTVTNKATSTRFENSFISAYASPFGGGTPAFKHKFTHSSKNFQTTRLVAKTAFHS